MAMSKKDFIALADALRAEMPGKNWNPNKAVQWDLDVKAIADVCQRSNPRFMRERWLGYIRGENGKNGGEVKGHKASCSIERPCAQCVADGLADENGVIRTRKVGA